MRNWGKTVMLGALLLTSTTACFRQVVQTGRAPSQTVVKQNWVSTWIFGIVPATPIDARAQCPTGIATVETQTSFANGLLGFLTIGIWTPQTAWITCAAGTAALPQGTEVLYVVSNADDSQLQATLHQAAARSAQLDRPVAVQFGNATSAAE